jgi:peptidyl-prolyl cis-trans isomerase A (cyclophilin A)
MTTWKFVLISMLFLQNGCDSSRALWAPSQTHLQQQSPDSFSVVFETSAGDFQMMLYRSWSPLAVDRIHYLSRYSFFSGSRFFRINPSVVQFGYSGEPALDSIWRMLPIKDEPVISSNLRGTVSFARGGPDSRDFQLFINTGDNQNYDTCCDGGFPPIGKIINGMEVIQTLNDEHGEEPVYYQDSIMLLGNEFLDRQYPRLDTIQKTRIRRF